MRELQDITTLSPVNMHRHLKTTILLLMLASHIAFSQNIAPPTRYDWTEVAHFMTKGCSNDYGRLKSIHRWLCANISFDTDHKIYHADECWDNKKGVCQAYSELFYHIAKALDLKVEIVFGKAKDPKGKLESHAWIYAETRDNPGAGILIDPTWGAGSVDDGIFKRSDNPMSWFHTNPNMMIFTHYPDSEYYQQLERTVTYETFRKLPPINPEVELFGFNAKWLLKYSSNPAASLPRFYTNKGDAPFYIRKIPMQERLRPGETYRFAIRKKSARFSILCDKEYIHSNEWEYKNGVYTLDYTVPCGKELKISWYNEQDKLYYCCVLYKISPPTSADLRNLEKRKIFSMPEIKALKGVNAGYLEEMGFNGKALLRAIRDGEVTVLPELYEKDAIKVIDVPLNGTLYAGKEYSFRIRPKRKGNWAVINGKEWNFDWEESSNGKDLEIRIIPKPGILKISIQYEEKGGYYTCLKYNVR